jgi:hypothetical protein
MAGRRLARHTKPQGQQRGMGMDNWPEFIMGVGTGLILAGLFSAAIDILVHILK